MLTGNTEAVKQNESTQRFIAVTSTNSTNDFSILDLTKYQLERALDIFKKPEMNAEVYPFDSIKATGEDIYYRMEDLYRSKSETNLVDRGFRKSYTDEELLSLYK